MAGNDNGIPPVADIIVVGSGSAGAVVARRLVDAGASVVAARGRRARRQPGDPRSRRGCSSCGTASRTGATAPCRRRACAGPRAALAARQGAGRVERAQRDDLRARAPQRLRHVGVPRQRGLGLRRRAARCSSAPRTSTGARPPTTARAGRCTCSRATSRTRSTPRSSPPRRRPASRSTTTTTASSSTASRSASSTSGTAVRQTGATAFLAPVAGSPDLTVLTGRVRTAAALRGRRAASASRSSGTARSSRSAPSARSSSAPARSSRPSCCCSRASAPADELGRLGIDVVADLPGRRAQPARPRALAGHLRGLAAGSAAAAGPPAAAQPPLLAQPAGPSRRPTSSRSSSTCRSTSRAWRARPTATR